MGGNTTYPYYQSYWEEGGRWGKYQEAQDYREPGKGFNIKIRNCSYKIENCLQMINARNKVFENKTRITLKKIQKYNRLKIFSYHLLNFKSKYFLIVSLNLATKPISSLGNAHEHENDVQPLE